MFSLWGVLRENLTKLRKKESLGWNKITTEQRKQTNEKRI